MQRARHLRTQRRARDEGRQRLLRCIRIDVNGNAHLIEAERWRVRFVDGRLGQIGFDVQCKGRKNDAPRRGMGPYRADKAGAERRKQHVQRLVCRVRVWEFAGLVEDDRRQVADMVRQT